jgi:hypothetical protein
MRERRPQRIIALSAAIALGTPLVAGCSKFEEKYSNCITTFIKAAGVFTVKETIVNSLDEAMQADTGQRVSSKYKGATAAAKKIQELLVQQYEDAGQEVDLSDEGLMEKEPFKNSMIRYCVGNTESITGTLTIEEPGSIHVGNSFCIMNADNYAKAVSDENSRQMVKDLCGGEQALPKNLS